MKNYSQSNIKFKKLIRPFRNNTLIIIQNTKFDLGVRSEDYPPWEPGRFIHVQVNKTPIRSLTGIQQ